ERLIAVLIEHHHDEYGIQWPISVAPYAVSLVSLATAKTPEVASAADEIYQTLQKAQIETLYDDRDERAGVKFNDADLLGMPLRLTVGGKGLQSGVVEYKVRRTGESGTIPLNDLVNGVQALLAAEWAELAKLRQPEGLL